MYGIGAILVGYIEEFLFRGAVFGMLKKMLGVWAGAMLASLLFAAVHFAAPDPPVGVVYGHWYSGFRMLPHMISPLDIRWTNGFMFVSLFLMGMVLCLLYDHYKNLYVAIGLHAGWVWIMRIGIYFMDRDRMQHLMLFGASMTVPKSLIAVLLLSLFLLAVVVLRQWGHRDRVTADVG